jgi:hypothetical protein
MEPKLIYLARRNPGLTRAGFTARWRQHGALGMSMPRWINIRRYVHCDVQQPGVPGIDETYDGVGLIWHRSPEARARHRADNSSLVASRIGITSPPSAPYRTPYPCTRFRAR